MQALSLQHSGLLLTGIICKYQSNNISKLKFGQLLHFRKTTYCRWKLDFPVCNPKPSWAQKSVKSLKCQFDQIFRSLCLWIFRKFMQRLLTWPSRFSTRVLEVRFFPRYFSNFASAIDRPCSYRAVGGMGPVTSYS